MERNITIGIKFTVDGKDLEGAVVITKDELKKLTEATKDTTAASRHHEEVSRGLIGTLSSYRQAILTVVAAYGGYKALEYIHEATSLAARYETLGVSMSIVGKNAGYTAAQMESYSQGLQRSGISMIESRTQIMRLAGAHIDLAMAEQLGRAAQDAAVIGNINSSEAFARMIHGIQTGQTEILRNIGLNINSESAYAKLALQMNVHVNMLSEQDKAQARANAVLEDAKKNFGTYEAAMGTAGKQLNSMVRYVEDFKVKLGSVFLEEFTNSVFAQSEAWKYLGKTMDDLIKDGTAEKWGHNLATIMHALTNAVVVAAKFIIEHKDGLVALGIVLASVVVSMASASVAMAVYTSTMSVYTLAANVATAATLRFTMALMANPFTLLIVGLGAAAAAMYYFKSSTAAASDEIDKAQAKVDRFNASTGKGPRPTAGDKEVLEKAVSADEELLEALRSKLPTSIDDGTGAYRGKSTRATDIQAQIAATENSIATNKKYILNIEEIDAKEKALRESTLKPASTDAFDKLVAKYKDKESWETAKQGIQKAYDEALKAGLQANAAEVQALIKGALSGAYSFSEIDDKQLVLNKKAADIIDRLNKQKATVENNAQVEANAPAMAAAKAKYDSLIKIAQTGEETQLSVMKANLALGLVTQEEYAAAEMQLAISKAQASAKIAENAYKKTPRGAGREGIVAAASAASDEANANVVKVTQEQETKLVEARAKAYKDATDANWNNIKSLMEGAEATRLANEEIGKTPEQLVTLKALRQADTQELQLNAAAAYENAAAVATQAASLEKEGSIARVNLEAKSALYAKVAADLKTVVDLTGANDLKKMEGNAGSKENELRLAQQATEEVGKTATQVLFLKAARDAHIDALNREAVAQLRIKAIATGGSQGDVLMAQANAQERLLDATRALNDERLGSAAAASAKSVEAAERELQLIGKSTLDVLALRDSWALLEIAKLKAQRAGATGTEDQLQLLDQQIATQERLRELTLATGQANATPQWKKNLAEWGDTNRLMRESFDNFVLGGIKAGEDAFIEFAKTGKINFKSLTDFIITEMARAAFRQSIAPMFGNAATGLGNLFKMGVAAFSGTEAVAAAHSGVGPYESFPDSRAVSTSVFANAPRYHSGVGPHERPAIITNDESVLTPAQMRALSPAKAAGGGPVNVTVQIENKSGTELKATQNSAPTFNGEKYIVGVVLDALQNNPAVRRTMSGAM